MNPVKAAMRDARPIYHSISSKLTQALHPTRLSVLDTSQSHAEHLEMRHSGFTETHFEIDIVSASFTGLSRVQRHRLVYEQLQDEFSRGLHAVSIKAASPEECTE